jgi:hypothetical protein
MLFTAVAHSAERVSHNELETGLKNNLGYGADVMSIWSRFMKKKTAEEFYATVPLREISRAHSFGQI